jgi:hypothetical protein
MVGLERRCRASKKRQRGEGMVGLERRCRLANPPHRDRIFDAMSTML